MIKVMIADDQELIRQSLQIVLEMKEGIEVTATAKDGREVIQEVRKDKPDVILMDVRMPEMDGVQCTQIIKEQYPDIKIIILTTFDDDEYVYNALKHGASGYLLKGISMDELEKIKIYAQMLLEVVNQAEIKRYQEKKDAANAKEQQMLIDLSGISVSSKES